jgi:hypothetical protein
MEEQVNENIRAKIQKLFSMAERGHGNESDVALRKAREIMDSYGITPKDLEIHILDVPLKRKEKWIVMLFHLCADFSGVVGLAGRDSMALAGDDLGVNVAMELFGYLKNEINRRTKTSGVRGLKPKNDFRIGCVAGIGGKMEKLGGWRDMKEKANRIIKEHFSKKKIYPERVRQVDHDVFNSGIEAGTDININRQAGERGVKGFLEEGK